jgi:hypothetical protein
MEVHSLSPRFFLCFVPFVLLVSFVVKPSIRSRLDPGGIPVYNGNRLGIAASATHIWFGVKSWQKIRSIPIGLYRTQPSPCSTWKRPA